MDARLSRSFPPLPDLHLGDRQVQIWQAWLGCSAQALSDYAALLSQDERGRAARFFFDVDRNHYIACRGLLRRILGAYLDIHPARLEFVYGAQKKPALKSSMAGKNLEFNLSHSKGLGVFAFSWGNPLGIDVENIRALPDADGFAEQFFSPSEIAWIVHHSGVEKQTGFFKIWTCKEAFFKANGDGLTLPMKKAVVDLDTGRSVRLAAIDGNQEQASRWEIISFVPAAGYQATLAVRCHELQITYGWLAP